MALILSISQVTKTYTSGLQALKSLDFAKRNHTTAGASGLSIQRVAKSSSFVMTVQLPLVAKCPGRPDS